MFLQTRDINYREIEIEDWIERVGRWKQNEKLIRGTREREKDNKIT